MDKNNRKLNILYKCITANTSALWQHVLHIPPTKVTAQQQKDKSHTKESTFREMEV